VHLLARLCLLQPTWRDSACRSLGRTCSEGCAPEEAALRDGRQSDARPICVFRCLCPVTSAAATVLRNRRGPAPPRCQNRERQPPRGCGFAGVLTVLFPEVCVISPAQVQHPQIPVATGREHPRRSCAAAAPPHRCCLNGLRYSRLDYPAHFLPDLRSRCSLPKYLAPPRQTPNAATALPPMRQDLHRSVDSPPQLRQSQCSFLCRP